jgi:hypothetical protein
LVGHEPPMIPNDGRLLAQEFTKFNARTLNIEGCLLGPFEK